MLPPALVAPLDALLRKAPVGWLAAVCAALRAVPASATPESVLRQLPTTHNADLVFLLREMVQQAAGQLSWEALSWALATTAAAYARWQAEQQIELLWAGPAPAHAIPARRIDQTLYDLIATAQHSILLVTFAAAKIQRLTTALAQAAQRGVQLRLVLEFEQTSEGQLSYDALKAFPPALIAAAAVYQWPVAQRERNPLGRPGKLHAKVAVIDDIALVSSANLTDDAFSRNLEVGVLVKNPVFLASVTQYFEALILDKTLQLVE